MSFPPGTEMFQFPGFASHAYEFSTGSPCGGVSPFGHPRINDRSHLPAAFRSVPRPSSPLGAKASTERPSLTHHHHKPSARTQYQTAHQTLKPSATASTTLTHTHIHPDSPVKDRPRREQVSTEGVSWKRPAARSEDRRRSARCLGARRQLLTGHREKRAEPDDPASSLKDRSQPKDIRPRRHDTILERR
jgi:hypothetical protein